MSVSVSGGPVTIYQYDGARNLRAIVSTGPDGTPVAGYRYTVDANGNRTAVSALEPNTATLHHAGILTYSFDAANHPVSRSDGATYKYDSRGNLTAIEGSTQSSSLRTTPSAACKACRATPPAPTVYDSTGLRAIRNDRRLVYDLSGDRPRIVMETDASGAPIAWYVYGLGLLWKVTADGTPYFYHFDGDGNIVALSNPTAGRGQHVSLRSAGPADLRQRKASRTCSTRAAKPAGWTMATACCSPAASSSSPNCASRCRPRPIPRRPCPNLRPPLSGAGACFLEGVANCLRRQRKEDR